MAPGYGGATSDIIKNSHDEKRQSTAYLLHPYFFFHRPREIEGRQAVLKNLMLLRFNDFVSSNTIFPECQKNVAIVPPTVLSVYLCQIVTISYPPTLHLASE